MNSLLSLGQCRLEICHLQWNASIYVIPKSATSPYCWGTHKPWNSVYPIGVLISLYHFNIFNFSWQYRVEVRNADFGFRQLGSISWPSHLLVKSFQLQSFWSVKWKYQKHLLQTVIVKIKWDHKCTVLVVQGHSSINNALSTRIADMISFICHCKNFTYNVSLLIATFLFLSFRNGSRLR